MANYSNLKNIIDQVVRTNGQGDITGANLNQTLQQMVTDLGANYQYAGVATPSTNPGSPDQNVFYIATLAGTYSNFNKIVLPRGINVLLWNGSWSYTNLYTVDAEPTDGSRNLVESGGVAEEIGLVYTKNLRANKVIEKINIDLSEYTGSYELIGPYRIEKFGWYSPTNIIYGQLYNANGERLDIFSIGYSDYVPVYVTGINNIKFYISCNWKEFKDNAPHQVTIYLTDNCFIKSGIIPSELPNGIVNADKIADSAVTTNKIANSAVNADKIADSAVTTNKLNNEAVKTSKLGRKAVTSDKINDDAIIPDKIANKAVKNYHLGSSIYVLGDNIISQATLHQNHFLLINGSESTEYSFWQYYELAVVPHTTYKVTAVAGLNARLWIVLNQEGAAIAYSSNASAVDTKTETFLIPDTGVKLVINARNEPSDIFPPILQLVDVKINAEEVFVGNKSIKQYVDDLVGSDNNVLFGKTLVCCGDSITYGADMDAEGIVERTIEMYQQGSDGVVSRVTTETVRASYGYQVAARNGMVFCNAGVSGSTMQGLSERAGFSLANGRYTKLPDNIDYLTIWFGWNDGYCGTLGTINDTTNESFYGGYNVVLPYLINKYPYAKIAIVVPFLDETQKAFNIRAAVRELANKWGVACFDFYGPGTPLYYGKEPSVGVNSTIVTANRAKFQANGAHPNFKGHRQLSNMLEEFLRGI